MFKKKKDEMALKPVMAVGVVMMVVSFLWTKLPFSQKQNTRHLFIAYQPNCKDTVCIHFS
jgi:hypothetical protein